MSHQDLLAPRWTSPDWRRELLVADLQEDAVWREVAEDVLQDRLSPEGRSTAGYAFTAMLDNAIDHSAAATVRVSVWVSRHGIRAEVSDDGRGALPHLQQLLALEDVYDALGELTKGKTTTDPERHTGEGIFFTSKAVDVFTLESAGVRWTLDNVRADQAVGGSEVQQGTRVLGDGSGDHDVHR